MISFVEAVVRRRTLSGRGVADAKRESLIRLDVWQISDPASSRPRPIRLDETDRLV